MDAATIAGIIDGSLKVIDKSIDLLNPQRDANFEYWDLIAPDGSFAGLNSDEDDHQQLILFAVFAFLFLFILIIAIVA